MAKDSTGARDTAGQIMRRIARTDPKAKTWDPQVKDLFTATGKQQLALMDRSDLSFTQVKGQPALLATEQPSMNHWPIIVRTDRGSWMVTMTQKSGDWQAEAISKWDR